MVFIILPGPFIAAENSLSPWVLMKMRTPHGDEAKCVSHSA
jgi:hypothetical protein